MGKKSPKASPKAAPASPQKQEAKKQETPKADKKEKTPKAEKKVEKVEEKAEKGEKKPREKKKGVELFAGEEYVNPTAKGQLKSFSEPMSDSYNPPAVEAAWDTWWEAQGLYHADNESKAEKFVVVIPPPNVTGTLHLGHALTCSIEDAIIRWNRMCGKNTLWVPGTDHAGIATQVVVEKKLMRERKLTRHDLGREKFLAEVWKWKDENGATICNQLRRLGTSVDWSREAFTMDDRLNVAVKEAFVRMHKDGLIYRANRLVSWSCTLKTAISTIEVDYEELDGPTMLSIPGYEDKVEFGVLHSFAYKVVGSDDEIVVSTTRIETMLGDTAVAVHPKDPRYAHLHGKYLVHPFVPDRKVLIITDDVLVDMAFGTGAVKVTPGHDPNDFECGVRNKLPAINILDDDGNINENGGKYQGQKRFVTRSKIVDDLKSLGLYRGKQPNKMSLGLCSRSKDVIEPVIRPQWWVNCKGMAKRSVDAVRNGELKIMPSFHEQTWFRWLENIQDWCVSRQLWWGHRIPAYLVKIKGQVPGADETDANSWIIARSDEEAMAAAIERYKVPAKDIKLEQDDDVLDTWFSSGIFPFSVMNWPGDTKDMAAFYPNSLLETGHDILFFWVARMVMMGLQLTDQLPFKEIYLHAMVRDKIGRKMSKSLGNVVDPLDVMNGITLEALHQKLLTGNLDPKEVEKAKEGQRESFPAGIAQCGADALRFGLLAYTVQGRDINLDIQRVVAYRQFCNKLWNATKFCLIYFDEGFKRPSLADVQKLVKAGDSFADKWILHRLFTTTAAVNKCFKNYEFGEACTHLYNFWLYDLCDHYLEMIKPIVQKGKNSSEAKRAAALATLFACLDAGLKLTHPMMPFVTEELYHRLPKHAEFFAAEKKKNPKAKASCGSIMVQPYPVAADFASYENASLDVTMALVKEIAHTARSTRASLGALKEKLDVYLICKDAAELKGLSSLTDDLGTLSGVEKVVVTQDKKQLPTGCLANVVTPTVEAYFPIAGKADVGAELIKLEATVGKLDKQIEGLVEKMSAGVYAEKTAPEVQAEHKTKLENLRDEKKKLLGSVKQFQDLLSPEEKKSYKALKEKAALEAIDLIQKQIEKIKSKVKGGEPNKKTQGMIADKEKELAEAQAVLKAL